ncbi:MAG: D-cysteine desulfhydrase family protein [Pseudomonadota bacterium]
MSTKAALRNALDRHPNEPLSHLPTPIDALKRWPESTIDVDIRIKRDDCTGLAMGGNKSRQLSYYIGDAISKGCDTLLSTGAVQSNYMRILAAAAAKCGLQCHIQLEDRVDNRSSDYQRSGNVLLDHLFGATIHYYAEGEDEDGADSALAVLAEDLTGKGRRPYIIPLGGDHKPTGALGYVEAALELIDQFEGMNWSPDVIVVGSGSGLTHSGLLCGLRLAGSSIPVLGACVRRPVVDQFPRIKRHTQRLQQMLDMDAIVADSDILLDDRALAPGYGLQSDLVVHAIRDMATMEGILLDPVYSGKTCAVLYDQIKRKEIGEGSRCLIMHTGGTPAIFAYREKMQQIADL